MKVYVCVGVRAHARACVIFFLGAVRMKLEQGGGGGGAEKEQQVVCPSFCERLRTSLWCGCGRMCARKSLCVRAIFALTSPRAAARSQGVEQRTSTEDSNCTGGIGRCGIRRGHTLRRRGT
jgi:hypothetical protein